jgi:proteasome accessory factor B
VVSVSARKSERLLNLLITLLVSRTYVTKQRLREVIPDYAEAASDEAFEKMFERDKEDLRALGIPIEVGGFDPLFDDEQGYRIKREAFELPEMSLEPDEAAVVGLAARVWQQAGLASATSAALLKLKAAGVDVDREALDVVQPQMASDEPGFDTFWEGVTTRRQVRFSYRRSDAAKSTVRRLQPWGIVSYRSRWYVVGHDLDRDDTRLFRVSRVVGDVAFDGSPGAFEVPEGVDLREHAASLAPRSPERTAVLRVRPDRAVALRQRATAVTGAADGWDRVELTFGRFDAAADDLASYGPDLVVDEPEDLRAAVVRRLRAVAGTEVPA